MWMIGRDRRARSNGIVPAVSTALWAVSFLRTAAPRWTGHRPVAKTFVKPLSVEIRLREWECVLDQFKAWFRVVRNDDFHDIEAEKNIGIVEHPQPSQSAA